MIRSEGSTSSRGRARRSEQLYEMNIKPDYIVAATGTGATQAGLLLGKILTGLDSKIIGISVEEKLIISLRRSMILSLKEPDI